jgi:phage-related protein (TIGR01555 family)
MPTSPLHAALSARRADAWSNVITGLGSATGRDKRSGADFATTILGLGDCEEFYRADDMAARAADLLPREMTREGWDVAVEGDSDAAEKMEAEHKRLSIHDRMLEGMIWGRVFGGAGLLIGARDGEADPIEPLNEAKIRSVDWLTVFDARELIAVQWYGDPGAAKYGEPEIYRLQPLTLDSRTIDRVTRSEKSAGVKATAYLGYATYVHESRVVRFEGVKLTRRQMRAQVGWGDSIYNRLYEEIRDFQAAFDSTSALLQDFAQAVIKIEGLLEILAGNQSDVLQNRMAALDMGRSVVRAYLLDSKEDFERKATPTTGLPELLEQFALRLAAAVEVPVSLLMGQAPAGLNATGDSDIRWFYDRVAARQRSELQPVLERLTRLLFLAKDGPSKGIEPKNWSIQFRPLWQLDEVQEADRRLKIAQADAAVVGAGIVTPEEVATTRYGGDEYNGGKIQLVEEDPEARAAATQENAEAEAEAAAAALAAKGGQPDKGATGATP